jgi:integrase
MPRLWKKVPSYCKHRGSGQAVCTINGKDFYLGLYGSKGSRIEYDRLITEWMASGRSLTFGAVQESYLVLELAADFLRFAKSYYGVGPKTQYSQYIRALRPLTNLYGRTPAAEFGVQEFRAVRHSLIAPTRSRGYINECMSRVVAVFKWAAAEGKLPANIAQNLAIVPGLRRGNTEARETAPIFPVDDAKVEATLSQLPDVVADMVRLQRATGARPAEVCMLRPCDVDRSGDVWIYRPRRHKTMHHGRERLVLIGPKAQAVLLCYLARDAETNCFRPVDSEARRLATRRAARNTPLHYGNRAGTNRKQSPRRTPGELYDVASYRRAIHRACDKAFPHPALGKLSKRDLTTTQLAELRKWQSDHRWSPNQLRHAAATEVRREFGLEAAQVILGHSQANVTQVYAERDLQKGIEVARRIG